jgi:multidrug efflux pump subunit AcrA (membrane-fusion protein)
MHERVKVVEEPDMLRHKPPRRLKMIGLAALGVAAIVVGVGVISRVRADQSLAAWTDDQAVPVVKLIDVSAAAGGTLVLPGAIQAYYDAPIHARVSGYLKRWYADIGTPVKAGQLLAEIDTPDLDQQLAQGKADLATAVANQNLSSITAKR